MEIKDIFKNELKGWKIPEVLWLFSACIIITGLSIYWDDSLMGIISATTGVICVVLTGKGKLSAYLFGLINCTLYAIISYQANLYGETMLNLIYYLPMQFVGLYIWKKNMNVDTHEVNKIHMKNKSRVVCLTTIVILTIGYGILLRYLGDAMPFIDSFTTIASIIAMIVSVKMFSEQWWIWIVVDVFSVYMWWCNFQIGSENIATLLMWVVYLGNAIIMCIKWEREVRAKRINVQFVN